MRRAVSSWLIFLLCAPCLFFCACIAPTNQLRTIPFRTLIGTVVDNNGQPVKQATVTTDPPTSTVLTDDLGKFIITSLAEGTYTIQVSKQGFAINSAVIAIKGLGPFHADIQLTKRVLSTAPEQEKLIPQTQGGNSRKEKEEGASWWPTK